MKTIALFSYKGGVGKTTIAVNLAGYLSESGYSVALVDGDDNESALTWASSMNFLATKPQRHEVDYLIVDTAARPTPEEVNTLVNADLVITPSTPDALSLTSLFKVIQLLQNKNYRTLLTRVPAGRPDGQEARDILNERKIPLFASSIREYAVHQKAALYKQLVFQVKSDSKRNIAWKDITSLGKEVIELLN